MRALVLVLEVYVFTLVLKITGVDAITYAMFALSIFDDVTVLMVCCYACAAQFMLFS